MSSPRHSLEKLEELRILAAQVVTLHGEKYLPIFERFDEEIEKRKSTMSRVAMIASAAKNP